VISSPSNPHVKHIRSLAADRKERRRERMFVLEGVRLVADALASGAALELALFAPERLAETAAGQALADQLAELRGAYPATAQVLGAASDTVHPQGVVALARWPELAPAQPGIVLVLDAIQDPGNLGTILRSAEAAGVSEVLCGRGSADLYAPKVVRAAMGAHLRLAMRQDIGWETLDESLALVDHVYAADASATMPYYAADWRQRCALLIGNEAGGLSDDARARASRLIGIPMRGGAESLNAGVAASVILFEALRQRSHGRSSQV
jgi:RNA methyltransferase, TrmH family